METSSGMYESSNSFFVLDVMNVVCKAIPVMPSRLQWLKQHHFGAGIPQRFPYPLVGVVPTGLDVKTNHGKIQMLSPPELVWAPIFWLKEFLMTSPSAEDCAAARQLFLDVVVSSEKIGSKEDRVWRSYQLRENLVNDGESVKLAPVQRLCAIMDSRAAIEKKLAMKPNTLGAAALIMATDHHRTWLRASEARVCGCLRNCPCKGIVEPRNSQACLRRGVKWRRDPSTVSTRLRPS